MNLAYIPETRRPPITDRPVRVLCFGEVLWDCLPSGRKPGGAPANVAYHLHRLGCEVQLISAVGPDAAGDAMLDHLRERGLSTALVQRHATLPTGTVEVALGPAGQPAYDIRTGVAWDEIALTDAILAAARDCDALVYGTLAARSETNRRTLDALLEVPGPLRCIDVNLRAPFDDPGRALALCRRADWIKLNDGELAQLTGLPIDGGELPDTIDRLREMTGRHRVCVTRGEKGAILWQQIAILAEPPPRVQVVDTVGAGDAFTAALLHGLLTLPITHSPTVLRRALHLGALVASLPGAQPDYATPWTPTAT